MIKSHKLYLLVFFAICVAISGRASFAVTGEAGPVSVDADVIQITPTASGGVALRGAGNAEARQDDVTVTASEIRVNSDTGSLVASGDVKFTNPQGTLAAQNFDYNYLTGVGNVSNIVATKGMLIVSGESAVAEPPKSGAATGTGFGVVRLKGASATTCDKEHPDYKITAKQIELYPEGRMIARHVSLWLGQTKLITLPKLAFNISGGKGSSRKLLPGIGGEKEDGFFVSLIIPIITAPRFYTGLDGRLTTKEGPEGTLKAEYLLAGASEKGGLDPADVGPLMDLRALPLMRLEESGDNEVLTSSAPVPAQLRLLTELGYKQRFYDIDQEHLLVSQLPLVGLKYTAPSAKIGPEGAPIAGLAASSAMVSYSNVSEYPGVKNVDRFDARALLSLQISNLGRKTALQPVVLARYSGYSTGDSYKVLAGSLNLAHIFSKQSYGSVRLIKYWTSGNTPFEVDDVDINSELQNVLWYKSGKNRLGIEVDYGLGGQGIYDWGFTYGRTLHCLEPQITWRNKFESFSFDLKVLGF